MVLVEPEKHNLLDLAGSQSRAEVANGQLQGGKHLFGRGNTKKLKKNSACESTFLEIYFFKTCPKGKICGNFLKKRQKMYFIEGRF